MGADAVTIPSPDGTLEFEPTLGGSVYIRPQDIEWRPTQFNGISIKVLYEDKAKGEMTCLLKWEPGATLPMHKHPAIEQSYVIEGSFYDHDGVCRRVSSSGGASVLFTRPDPMKVPLSLPCTASQTSSGTVRAIKMPAPRAEAEQRPIERRYHDIRVPLFVPATR